MDKVIVNAYDTTQVWPFKSPFGCDHVKRIGVMLLSVKQCNQDYVVKKECNVGLCNMFGEERAMTTAKMGGRAPRSQAGPGMGRCAFRIGIVLR